MSDQIITPPASLNEWSVISGEASEWAKAYDAFCKDNFIIKEVSTVQEVNTPNPKLFNGGILTKDEPQIVSALKVHSVIQFRPKTDEEKRITPIKPETPKKENSKKGK